MAEVPRSETKEAGGKRPAKDGANTHLSPLIAPENNDKNIMSLSKGQDDEEDGGKIGATGNDLKSKSKTEGISTRAVEEGRRVCIQHPNIVGIEELSERTGGAAIKNARSDTLPKEKERFVFRGAGAVLEELEEAVAKSSTAVTTDDFPKQQKTNTNIEPEKSKEAKKKKKKIKKEDYHYDEQILSHRTRSAKRRRVAWFFDTALVDHGIASVVLPFCDIDSLMRLRLVTKKLTSAAKKELLNQAMRRLPLLMPSVERIHKRERWLQMTLSLSNGSSLHERKEVLDRVIKQSWLQRHHSVTRRLTERLEQKNKVAFRCRSHRTRQNQRISYSILAAFDFMDNGSHQDAKISVGFQRLVANAGYNSLSDEDKTLLKDFRTAYCILLQSSLHITRWRYFSAGSIRANRNGVEFEKKKKEGVFGVCFTMPGDVFVELKVFTRI